MSNAPYLTGEGFRADGQLINLTLDKICDAVPEGDWLRVWDDFEEDYLYPPRMFLVL
jgi:hypothetical protein